MKLNSQKLHCQAFYIYYVVGNRFFYAFFMLSALQNVRLDYGTLLSSRIAVSEIDSAVVIS